MEETKNIKVTAKTHAQAKTQAEEAGMLLKKYIQMLLTKDKKRIRKT